MSPKLHKFALAAIGVLALSAGALWWLAQSNAEGHGLRASANNGSVENVELGLMSSLPLYWPLGADLAGLIDAEQEAPWQRGVLEARYDLKLLDSLSPDDQGVVPLAGLERLAIIQPRGLSPSDNVVLDDWVQGGGRLLIALDPMLTGEYEVPLGDPRRPVDAALIPPVIERWGLAVSFDEEQGEGLRSAAVVGGQIPVHMAGVLTVLDPSAASCELQGDGAIAACDIGQGRVTVVADVAIFEHEELAGEDGERLIALLAQAFN